MMKIRSDLVLNIKRLAVIEFSEATPVVPLGTRIKDNKKHVRAILVIMSKVAVNLLAVGTDYTVPHTFTHMKFIIIGVKSLVCHI